MDHASAVLLNLLRLRLAFAGDPQTLIPVEDMAADLLAGLITEHAGDHLAQAVTAILSGQQTLAAGYSVTEAITQYVDTSPQRLALFQGRLESFTSLVDQLLVVGALLRPALVEQVALQTDLQLFRFIQRLQLAREPQIIVVGRVPRGQETITFAPHGGPLLGKLQIAYTPTRPGPVISLTTASMAESAPWAPTRLQWHQEPGPEHALRVLNARAVDLGTISTVIAPLPYRLESGPLAITLAATSGVRVLLTTICDAEGLLLAQYARVAPA